MLSAVQLGGWPHDVPAAIDGIDEDHGLARKMPAGRRVLRSAGRAGGQPCPQCSDSVVDGRVPGDRQMAHEQVDAAAGERGPAAEAGEFAGAAGGGEVVALPAKLGRPEVCVRLPPVRGEPGAGYGGEETYAASETSLGTGGPYGAVPGRQWVTVSLPPWMS
jgi:hypothetical protein